MITDVNPARLALAAEVAEDVVPVDVSREDLASVKAHLGMKEGSDVGLEMSGLVGCLRADGRASGGRRKNRDARHSGKAVRGRLGQARVQDALRSRASTAGGACSRPWHKMLGMLQSGLNVRKVITHRLAADDFQRRLCHHAERQFRQDRAGLDGVTPAAPYGRMMRLSRTGIGKPPLPPREVGANGSRERAPDDRLGAG